MTNESKRTLRLQLFIIGVVAYVPLLLTSPGSISADTKAYLYLDSGQLLERAPYMWNTHINGGTVTHQNIGYLFPLGPWYWLFERLGISTVIAQRLWFGTLLFLAGAGTWWLLRKFNLKSIAAFSGAFVYMLSPYILAYMGRTSVILTPWAMLPWLIGLMLDALRQKSWRAPILFAIAVTFMAGTNASSVIFVLVGPALLIPYVIWVTKEVALRDAVRTIFRIAVATLPAQIWWVAGLLVQGRFGLPILELTETVETVAQTSTSAETLRGLGYWYFYGKDGLSGWTEAGLLYTTNLLMLAITFIVPLIGLVAAIVLRWKWRFYFIALTVVGLLVAIGSHPYNDPTPFASVMKFITSLKLGFALRNSPRIVPLVVLSFAALSAALVSMLFTSLREKAQQENNSRYKRLALAAPIGLIVIAVLNLPPLWNGQLIQRDMKFPEELPDYWQQAAATIDAQGNAYRLLEIPGADFAAYRFGQTQDPLTPGIISRDWVGRELTAYGSPQSVDLLRALDIQFQEGTADPNTIADIARLFSASDVLLRLDSQFERYHGPRSADLWNLLRPGTNDLKLIETFGAPRENLADPRQPTIDEIELARQGSNETPPLALFRVDGARQKLRAESTNQSVIVWGDGAGLVEMAGAGFVPRSSSIFYATTVTNNESLRQLLQKSTPSLVVTDTNRKRPQRWGTTRENNGATEAAGSVPLKEDPKDERIAVFDSQIAGDQTVAWYGDDVADVRATSYGNIVAFSTEARPINAIDGNPQTAWSTGGFADAVGERLQIDYSHPITADHIDLVQLDGNRYITKASIFLDGKQISTVKMNESSFVSPGQRVDFGGAQTFTKLEIRVDDTNIGNVVNYLGWSNVGFREVTVPGVNAQEWIVTPSLGLNEFASAPLSYVFSRWRVNPLEGYRQDPELQLRRIFSSPRATSLPFKATARLATSGNNAVIDRALGRAGLADGSPIVEGTQWLEGSILDRPSSAFDGNPQTAWQTKFGSAVGATTTFIAPNAFTVNGLDLTIRNDNRHSVPTKLRLTDDTGKTYDVDVPAVVTSDTRDSTVSVRVPTPTFTTKSLKIDIAGEREVLTPEYFSGSPHALPIAIVEFGIGQTLAPLPAAIPSQCRDDLLTINDQKVSVRLNGTTAAAEKHDALAVISCQGDIAVRSGTNTLVSAPNSSGFTIDDLSLGTAPINASSPSATLTVKETGELSRQVTVDNATEDFWLVLGQSYSKGWKATINGEDLGEPTLIDGFANGWKISPSSANFVVDISWTPQKTVNAGLAISGIWFVGLVLAAVWLLIRRRYEEPAADSSPTARQLFARDVQWSTGAIATLGIGALVGGYLAGGLVVGALLAALAIAAVALRRSILLLAGGTIISLGLISAAYMGVQLLREYPTGVEWPNGFFITHQLGFVAVGCVVLDAVIRFVNQRYKTTKATDDNQSNDGSALTR